MRHIRTRIRPMAAIIAAAILIPSAASAAVRLSASPTSLTWSWDDTSPRTLTLTVPPSAEWVSSEFDVDYSITPSHGRGPATITITPSSANASPDPSVCVLEFACDTRTVAVTLIHEGRPGSGGPSREENDPDDDGEAFPVPASGPSFICTTKFTSPDGSSHFSDVTYYDGLGYPIQTQGVSAGPDGQTFVTPLAYDCMRRADATAYLPYAASGRLASYVGDAIQAQAGFYMQTFSDSHPFGENRYAQWSGGRVLSSRMPGDRWAAAGAEKRRVHHRRSNLQSDAVVRYVESGGSVTSAGPYPEHSLVCDSSEDEEGDVSEVFSDPTGRLLCSRLRSGDATADTYYIYDIRDSLVCVIQPEGARILGERNGGAVSLGPSAADADRGLYEKYCFGWKYDPWGNVTEYHVPGGGTTFLTYDARNRLTSERTPLMDSLGVTRHMEYDACDRPTAEIYRRDTDGRGLATHSWTYFPFGEDSPAGSRGRLLCETVAEMPVTTDMHPRDLPITTRTYAYDGEGRVTSVTETESGGWSSVLSTDYDFSGNVISVTEERSGPGGYMESLTTSYAYDHRGRRTSCTRTLAGSDTGEMELSTVSYTYDELGRPSGSIVTGPSGDVLARMETGLDIRGWTTGITASAGSGDILFSEAVRYADPSGGAAPRYDGLVSETGVQHAGAEAFTCGYAYDGMKRLAGAEPSPSEAPTGHRSTEKDIIYDLDGNITSLTRVGPDGNEEILSFGHEGNSMVSVNGSTFAYDASGNLTYDGRKGLHISYNCLNLPSRIETGDGRSLTYTYLADGTLVSVTNGDGHGRRYRGSLVYGTERDRDYDVLESIAWDEGRIMLLAPTDTVPDDAVLMGRRLRAASAAGVPVPDEMPADSVAAVSMYRDLLYVRDHLGNVRTVLDVSPDMDEAAILEQDDYLPFGTRMERDGLAVIGENRYRYGAKEEQRLGGLDVELLDFGARYYDPFTTRWTSIDPMAGAYLGMTPYGYCGGDPINRVDADGNTWDTFFDIAFLTYDLGAATYQGIKGNTAAAREHMKAAGADLAFALIPGASSVYAKAALWADKGMDALRLSNELKSFKKASEFGVGSYKDLRKAVLKKYGTGSGLEVHHLIERRFAERLGLKEDEMLSIVLTKEEHQAFTKMWRDEIGYVNSGKEFVTDKVDYNKIMAAARKVLKDYPELLKLLEKQ